MIFISSQLPLTEIQTMSPEEIYNTTDWFLFDLLIINKRYWRDKNLYKMYDRLTWYPIFHKERLYNYLMSDNYYFDSHLHNILENYAQIIYMNKVKELYEIQDYEKEVIKQKDRIFGKYDIKQMMDHFMENNYREKSVCEYILG